MRHLLPKRGLDLRQKPVRRRFWARQDKDWEI